MQKMGLKYRGPSDKTERPSSLSLVTKFKRVRINCTVCLSIKLIGVGYPQKNESGKNWMA